MKEKALEFLNKEYLLNVDMIECIRRDICQIVYASDEAVLIAADGGWVWMLSCEDRALGLALIRTHQPPWVVLHQMDMRDDLAGLGYRVGGRVLAGRLYEDHAPGGDPCGYPAAGQKLREAH